ncbi:dynamin family protein [Helicobacter cetorum]|uniref:dynamin family protein n=1 Tax=Helicobacter cetorum TaxID=138563 RepID=UPI000CF0F383|nr:dynamin family protein [Helicobacter cetorum]
MSLQTQTNFIRFLEQTLEVLKEVEIDKLECSTLLESIQKQQLVIPIVGNFSAGKSSLINRFLNQSILPTAITPETSLATELHYSTNERIEAFLENNEKFESLELSGQSFERIKDNAFHYSYLKVYLNNEALKNSTPLVLVDMPGFDSPNANHTKAILEYLARGVYFVILTSVEEGNLTKRMLRELENILEVGKGFSFVLSKTNLRTPIEVEQLSSYIKEQLQDNFGLTTNIVCANKTNNALLEIISMIDTEKLFSDLYLKRLKFLNFQLQNSLKSVIKSFDYSKEKALEELQALESSTKNIESTYEKLRANLEEEYSSVAVRDILEDMENALKNKKSYLATLINNSNTFKSELESIVQQSLIKSTKDKIKEINISFLRDFSNEFQSLEHIFYKDMSCALDTAVETGLGLLGKLLTKNPNIYLKSLGWIILVVKPFLKKLSKYLPNALINEQKERERIEEKIVREIIPQIKAECEPYLCELFKKYLQDSLKALKEQCELEISHKKQEITLAQNEKEKHLNDLETQKQILENKISALCNLEQQYLKDR